MLGGVDPLAALARDYEVLLGKLGIAPAERPLPLVARAAGGRWLLAEGQSFADADALLYRLAAELVAGEGARWSARHRRPGEDPRRADFAHRLELMGRVSPEWQQRLAEELAQWLARHPLRDEGRL